MFIQYRNISIKSLMRKKKNSAGRNNRGRIVSFHRGGGHSRYYMLVDINRRLHDVPAMFLRYIIDRNRTAILALICYKNGILSYILGPAGLSTDNYIIAGTFAPSIPGNHMLLSNIVVGSHLHNIELAPTFGGSLVRSGGAFGQLLRKKKNVVFVKLASGEIRTLSSNCSASVGTLLVKLKKKKTKAGHSRWLGKKSVVRGVAMNPIDHPMGGGEGKASGGRPSVSPWGILTKSGWKTRKHTKKTKYLIRHKHLVLER